MLSLLRAGKIAQEFKLKALYVGTGDEYRLREQVAAMHPDLILKVDFPRPYRLDDDAEWLDVPLERLRRMDRAPSNPKWMKDAGLTFSFTTAGLDDAEDFDRRVREAVARGLSKDDALAAVTTVPARQLGFGDRLGTIEAGKIADLAVETGEPFSDGSRVTEIWIDGKRTELPEKKKTGGAGGALTPALSRGERGGAPAAAGRSAVSRTGSDAARAAEARWSCAARRCGRKGRRESSRTRTSSPSTERSRRSGRASRRRPARSRWTAAASTSRPASSIATRTPRSTATSTS